IYQNFTVDNPSTTSQAKDKYYKRWRRFWVFPIPVGLQTLSEVGNPGSIMVKFLLLTLALGVSCAHHTNLEITPSEVDRKWCTLYTGADSVEKVLKGGPLRAYFQHMECSDECQTLKVTFNIEVEEIEESLSKAQKQGLKKLAKEFNIPKENIQHLAP
ncbi:hypothetical protein A6R68_02574, partial [Neotoma lepida]